jgi:uncharacterized protein (DUF305 family)
VTAEPDPALSFSGPRRALVLTGATLVVLLVGAAIGMLITTARVDQPSAPSLESVDVGFAQDMQVHHLQAVTMAGIARDHTTDPEVHTLAFDIESTQLGQASEMAGWLTVWGRPELPDAGRGHMAWMAGSGHAHGNATTAAGGATRMPGMATTEELNRLRSLSGKELDVLFLQLMLRHHQGALPMAQFAADRAGTGYVRDLAKKIISGKTAEATLLTSMLARRGATPLPAPN